MKRIFALVLALLMLMSTMTGCQKAGGEGSEGEGEGNVEVVELKMNVTTSDASVWMVAANEFKNIVEEKTNGKFLISIYPNEQLSGGDLQKGSEMFFTGVTDIDLRSVINMTGLDPRLSVCTMPWLFPNGYESVDKYLHEGGNGQGAGAQKLIAVVEEIGGHVLGVGENGFRQLTNNKRPVHTPADMEKLKIRTPPMAMYIDLYKLLGADPTSMNFGEVFTSLQQNTIDGQENPYDTIRSAKIQEVSKYMTVWNYSYDPFLLSVSDKVWDSLTDEERTIFQEAGKAACQKQIEASRALDAQIVEEFSQVLEINELTTEEIDAFRVAVAPIYDAYRDTIGEDMLAAFGYTF